MSTKAEVVTQDKTHHSGHRYYQPAAQRAGSWRIYGGRPYFAMAFFQTFLLALMIKIPGFISRSKNKKTGRHEPVHHRSLHCSELLTLSPGSLSVTISD